MPVVSIIIPVYNAEKYLSDCLDSVLSQSYNDFELLLVDDGSTDESLTIMNGYEMRDTRIHTIHQKNGGAAKARNAGLDICKGDYIMFVDADDLLAPDMLQSLYNNLIESDVDCVVCRSYQFKVNEKPDVSHEHNAEPCVLSGTDAIHAIYSNKSFSYQLVSPCGRLFRRKTWAELRYSDGFYYEDLKIMPRLYWDMQRILFIPFFGYFVRLTPGSASRGEGTDNKRVTDSVTIRQEHIGFYEEKHDTEMTLAATTRLLDFLITCDLNGWIPPQLYKTYRDIFHSYLKKATEISRKQFLRYSLYDKLGKRGYNALLRGK